MEEDRRIFVCLASKVQADYEKLERFLRERETPYRKNDTYSVVIDVPLDGCVRCLGQSLSMQDFVASVYIPGEDRFIYNKNGLIGN